MARFKRKTLAPTEEPRIKEDIEIGVTDDIFEKAYSTKGSKFSPAKMGGVEKVKHDVEMLQMEWAIKYPAHSVWDFLLRIKGYSEGQAKKIMAKCRAEEWKKAKTRIMDGLTESMVKRQIDLMAETQEQHIKGAKLTFTRTIEMLTKGGVPVIDRKTGEVKLNEAGAPIIYPLRSIDLLNCANAVEKCQQIYRRAMGLPNEEGGLAQILEKIQQTAAPKTENHLHIHAPPTSTAPRPNTYTYEDLMELIEIRREQRKKQAGEQKTIELKAKAPEAGDFTALPAVGVKNK